MNVAVTSIKRGSKSNTACQLEGLEMTFITHNSKPANYSCLHFVEANVKESLTCKEKIMNPKKCKKKKCFNFLSAYCLPNTQHEKWLRFVCWQKGFWIRCYDEQLLQILHFFRSSFVFTIPFFDYSSLSHQEQPFHISQLKETDASVKTTPGFSCRSALYWAHTLLYRLTDVVLMSQSCHCLNYWKQETELQRGKHPQKIWARF